MCTRSNFVQMTRLKHLYVHELLTAVLYIHFDMVTDQEILQYYHQM